MADTHVLNPAGFLRRASRSLGLRLSIVLTLLLGLNYAFLQPLVLRFFSAQQEIAVHEHGAQIGGVVRAIVNQTMSRGEHDDVASIVGAIGEQRDIESVRVYDKSGTIRVSTRTGELDTVVEKGHEACAVCHQASAIAPSQAAPRIILRPDGSRVMSIVDLIPNQRACSTAACHAHDPSAKYLGVINTRMSLDAVDRGAAAIRGKVHLVLGISLLLTVLGFWWVLRRSLHKPLTAIRAGATQLARMDLDTRIPVESRDELGELATSFNEMVGSLRGLVRSIYETALGLNGAAAELHAAARQQEQGARAQAEALGAARSTTEDLAGAAHDIAEAARRVLENSEKTLQTHGETAKHIGNLALRSQRITEMLETIKEIATKSEILALNASLEGAKAGDVGRGFSLVAMQMQRLAEEVGESVKSIKPLVADIREVSSASVSATEKGTRLAADTTESARQIRQNTERQESASNEFSQHVAQVSVGVSENAASISQITSTAAHLSEQSTRLKDLISRFKMTADAAPPQP